MIARGTAVRSRLNRDGVSVVELMVGVVLLAVVTISLVGSSLYASRTLTRSRLELKTSEYMQAELERLLALPYASVTDGSRTTTKGSSTWTVTDQTSYKEILLIVNYAPTAGTSEWDTVVAFMQP